MPKFDRITNTYEHALAYVMHKVDNRGLLIDTERLKGVRAYCTKELKNNCENLSNLWGFRVYIGSEDRTNETYELNLNSPTKVLEALTNLGYKVPKVRKKNQESLEYEWNESVGELALQQLYADSSLWPSLQAGPGIKKLLDTRELITFKNRYVNAKLYKSQYFCNSNVAGTTTGRRGTKKNIFGFGGNNQNFPARGPLSNLWKQCVIARAGKIFLFVDQVSAEDWPVQALSENYQALQEMQQGINRHYKFANAIFGRPIDDLKRGRASGDFQCEMEYYLGKKGRHANNYGMQPTRLSEGLAAEGYSYDKATCKLILDKINMVDPNVRGIFHEYVRYCLFSSEHKLICPLGRERQFFGLRPNEKNYSVLNEAYAYIPQSTIGDNTGLAICYLDEFNDYLLQESHDSLCQEVPDNESELRRTFQYTREAFDRDIKYHNGIVTKIPIETEIGYNWKDKIKVKTLTEEGLLTAWKEVKELKLINLEKEKKDATALI